jgi:hypothetical protein
MVTCKSRRGIPQEQPELAEHKLNSKVITVLGFACHVLNRLSSRVVPSREVPGRAQDGTGQDRTWRPKKALDQNVKVEEEFHKNSLS